MLAESRIVSLKGAMLIQQAQRSHRCHYIAHRPAWLYPQALPTAEATRLTAWLAVLTVLAASHTFQMTHPVVGAIHPSVTSADTNMH